jgi:hypothetical protein
MYFICSNELAIDEVILEFQTVDTGQAMEH